MGSTPTLSAQAGKGKGRCHPGPILHRWDRSGLNHTILCHELPRQVSWPLEGLRHGAGRAHTPLACVSFRRTPVPSETTARGSSLVCSWL